MTRLRVFLLLLCFPLYGFYGFGTPLPIFSEYRSDFNPHEIECVETTMRGIAEPWEFRVFEFDRKGRKFVTDGVAAFGMQYYFDDPKRNKSYIVMDATNAGFGVILSVIILDLEAISHDELNRLAGDVVSALRAECGIALEEYISPRGQ